MAAMLLFVLAVLLAGSQTPKKPVETAHLSIAASVTREPANKATLALDIVPKPRMHVYAPGQEGYIAIAITLDSSPAFTAERAKYPAAEKFFMPALKDTQLVYMKPFRITQEVTLAAGAEPVTIKGTLRYQACDDLVCYLPKTVRVEWVIEGR
jgi:DsbC/DsbD-like thiol-disulfide interchange protein